MHPLLLIYLKRKRKSGPDTGAQNPEEAQQYVDRINNIFDHLSELIHEDKKDALGMTIQKLQEVDHEAVGDGGRCGC